MPVYDYECAECGVFTALRPMAAYAEPCECPQCGSSAARVMLTVPYVSGVSKAVRVAHETNERSADSPMRLSKTGHGANCSCCSGKKLGSRTRKNADGSKSFPSARPWMISH
jgi:putative FmdB family regulatory protein